MLEAAFRDKGDYVFIQTGQNADLYKGVQLRAKTKCSLQLLRDLLLADESAQLAHSPKEIQQMLNTFSEALKKFGLTINIKKTELLYQSDRAKWSKEVDITVDGVKLNSVPEFTYLGSTASNDGMIDVEIQGRMAKARASYDNTSGTITIYAHG